MRHIYNFASDPKQIAARVSLNDIQKGKKFM